MLVYLTTVIYLFILAMTLWLGGAVMVQSWLSGVPGAPSERQASRTWPARWTTGSSLLHGKLIQRSVLRQT